MADLLKASVEQKASDLHIAVGRPPVLRIHGNLVDMDYPPLKPTHTEHLIYSVLTDLQKQFFEENMELDFSLSIANISRYRVNVHYQRGTVAAAFRTIPTVIPTFEALHLPRRIMEYIARRPNGLALVTGPTGHGKSTTLAAIVDLINREKDCHIICAEDPIEYLHPHKKALVEQREVNEDTKSFSTALKFVLRQDPDVIMVGEMRDLDTITAALTAAETGHLVFSTLHTNDVMQTVDRIIDVFPPYQQQQVRVQLAATIEAVFCQRLLPSILGSGRELAIEILLGTDAVRSLIREGKTEQLQTMLETSSKQGMQTMDRSLSDLVLRKRISMETARRNAKKPQEVERFVMSGGK
ncbi:type IV pilus twitching motility protein PilT [Candidatus Sumerlaeota bacterium]|nr:type IV pilus twitching motility protein PilT [Candidatus Sumerlaeota bacterium]